MASHISRSRDNASHPSEQFSLWPLAGEEDSSFSQEKRALPVTPAAFGSIAVSPSSLASRSSGGLSGQAILVNNRNGVLALPVLSVPRREAKRWDKPQETPESEKVRYAAFQGERNSVPLEWTGEEPALKLARPWLGKHEIPMQQLSRHVMATGETGSGKTRSCIEPLLEPLLGYRLPTENDRDGKSVSTFIIDGKGELRSKIMRLLDASKQAYRLVILDGQGQGDGRRVRFFEGMDKLTVADKLRKIDLIAPAAWHSPVGSNAMWVEKAKSLLRGFASAEAIYDSACGTSLVQAALKLFQMTPTVPGQSFFEHVQLLLNRVCQSHKDLKKLNEFLADAGNDACCPGSDFQFLSSYVALPELIEQLNFVFMTLDILFASITSADATRLIDFDLFAEQSEALHISIYDMVEDGSIMLFSPSSLGQESVALVGRVLKTLFFQAVFTRYDKERPVAYVCDEFHRFVSSDADSGEQNLLDRCRAYRCICILATQSVESIRYALAGQPGAEAAIGVMLNNIGCKLFLRNSDTRTADLLTVLLPRAPGDGPHIVHVRPLSTLRAGEVYYLHADGSWGRRQVALA